MLTPAFASGLGESLSGIRPLLEQLHGRRVLITGANGLIAGTLLASLVMARKLFGIRPEITAVCHSNRRQVDALVASGADNIEVVTGNLARGLPVALRSGRFDYIVHAASLASPAKYLAHRLDTMKVNVLGTLALLEKGLADGASNVLFIGSGEIYGSPDPEYVPTPENYLPIVNHLSDRSCYSESKRFAESLCLQFSLETGQATSVVRPIHVFGPGLTMDDGRVVADFLCNALAGNRIVVKSDGSDRRAFCYSLDANVMLLHVLLGHNKGFEVFNIGNPGNDVSIAELATTIAAIANVEVEIQGAKPAASLETPARSAPDISKIQQRFGLSPRYGLRKGLELTLEWMRESQSLQ